ncbi:hypothetical protein HCA99_14660 [Listeria booriae]|uniref:hypothetical protein n=1 Tax=Listeria booriae TaxID=1552123 RepID=UPI0016276C97|nr:hypothetical protein [Listeria booriae]MBC2080469.1 hypothetical protein [Listeria booriae]
MGENHKKSNDAIPSWSGFNYQGMTMMLRVLNLINKNLKEHNSNENYKVELEKYEDFIIYQNGNAEEIYQVKAKISATRYSGYRDAVIKLMDHRCQINAPMASCFLISAVMITDWDTAKDKGDVQLFKYMDKRYIGVTDIMGYVKAEIGIYYGLKKRGVDSLDIDLAFQYLCQEINELIYNVHSKTNYMYDISFSKFICILDTTVDKTMINQLTKTHLKIQEHAFKTFSKTIAEFCGICDRLSCDGCAVDDVSIVFSKISMEKYAEVLEPALERDENQFYIINAYKPSSLESLLEQFAAVDKSLFRFDDVHLYFNTTGMHEEYLDKVIPTNLSLMSREKTSRGIALTLSEIENNKEISQIINQSAITADIKKEKINYKEEKINYNVGEGEKIKMYGNSIMPDFDFNIVNKDTFRKRNGGDGSE